MKKAICFLLVLIIFQLSLINTTAFATDVVNEVVLTEQEVIDTFYGDTQNRIDEIHSTREIIEPKNGAKGYYVSNQENDNNDGLSPNTPIATISAVNKLNLQSGDVVYFQRGGVWRGSVKAYTDGVAYSAYGEGNKPELYGSSCNYAEMGQWIETDAPNVYKYSKPINAECFLFKDTKDSWQNQTDDMIVREDLNCYRANEGNKNGGRWYCYSE